jgi:hypothetical protein
MEASLVKSVSAITRAAAGVSGRRQRRRSNTVLPAPIPVLGCKFEIPNGSGSGAVLEPLDHWNW